MKLKGLLSPFKKMNSTMWVTIIVVMIVLIAVYYQNRAMSIGFPHKRRVAWGKSPVIPMESGMDDDDALVEHLAGQGCGSENGTYVVEEEEEDKEDDFITDGDFTGGRFPPQKVETDGLNEIIQFSNPGSTSYVLRQSAQPRNVSGKIIYENAFVHIQIPNLLPEHNYYIDAWVHTTVDWDGRDYLFNVLMRHRKDDIFADDTYRSGDGYVLSVRAVDGRVWYNQRFEFTTPNNFDGTCDIYIGYAPENKRGFRYITGLRMRHFLEYARNLSVTHKLSLMLLGSNPASYNNTSGSLSWKDISGAGNDFRWTTSPSWNGSSTSNQGSFTLRGVTCIGPSGFSLIYPRANTVSNPKMMQSIQNKFTLVLDSKAEASTSTEESPVSGQPTSIQLQGGTYYHPDIPKEDSPIIFIPGNQTTAFALFMPDNNNYIRMVIADKLYTTSSTVDTRQDNTYFFIYDGYKVTLYVNNVKTYTTICTDQVYFNHSNIEINPLKQVRGTLRTVMIYNRPITQHEIDTVTTYIQAHRNVHELDKQEASPNIPAALLAANLRLPNTEPSTSGDNGSGNGGENGNGNGNGSGSGSGSGNGSGSGTTSSSTPGTTTLANGDVVVTKEDGTRITTKVDGSQIVENADGTYVKYSTDGSVETKLENGTIVRQNVNGSVTTTLADGTTRLATSGEKAQMETLKTGASTNIQESGVTPTGVNGTSNACPFIITDSTTPCRQPVCNGVDWTKDPLNVNFTRDCGKAINTYCTLHADEDENCMCWRDCPQADTPYCKSLRAKAGFEPGCTTENFAGNHREIPVLTRTTRRSD